MDNKFIVSARKYRPQTFETVVGQSHITTTLKNAIRNNQLAHAFLFCGPRGVGKTTCARILAKTINCENINAEGEACNKCQSCISFNEGTSLNIHELDAASNNSVDDIRTLVEQVRFAPQAGRYKVYIIDEVHMLSSSAFNAFLKTLEEPPPYAIFILATTEKHKILPTILSRCQIFDFKRITTHDTVAHLQDISKKEDITAEPEAFQLIAQKSEGCMRDALSILDKIVSFTNGEVTYQNTLEHLNILDAEYYFKLMDQLQQQDLAGAMLLYDDINRKGFEGDMVVEGFAEFIRNLLVCKDQRAAALLEVVESFKTKYNNAAKKIDPAYLISALNILNEVQINYKQARNKRLHVELALIKLCYLQQALQLVNSDAGPGKKKLIESAVPFRTSPIRPVKKALGIISEEQEMSSPLPIHSTQIVVNDTASKRKSQDAKLLIQQEEIATAVEEIPKPFQSIPAGSAKLTSLDKIRRQVSTANGGNVSTTVKLLTDEDLHQAWGLFTVKLREAKNHAAQSFTLAELRITDPNGFIIVVPNNIQQRFIETVRLELLEFLQSHFNNKALSYSILLEEKQILTDNGPAPLSRKEQYLKMIEQYPLVKELKDKLRLELDY